MCTTWNWLGVSLHESVAWKVHFLLPTCLVIVFCVTKCFAFNMDKTAILPFSPWNLGKTITMSIVLCLVDEMFWWIYGWDCFISGNYWWGDANSFFATCFMDFIFKFHAIMMSLSAVVSLAFLAMACICYLHVLLCIWSIWGDKA